MCDNGAGLCIIGDETLAALRKELHSLQAKPEYNGNLAGRWTSWAGAVQP